MQAKLKQRQVKKKRVRRVSSGAFRRNAVNLVMLEASKRQQVDISRISFIDAYRWLQAA